MQVNGVMILLPLLNINISRLSNMGCTSTRDDVYEIKQPEFSDRDINQIKCELEAELPQLSPLACGYQFDISLQNSQQFSTSNRKKVKQDGEFQKLSRFMKRYQEMKGYLDGGRIDEAYQLQQQLKNEYNGLDFNVVPELKMDKKEEMLAVSELVKQRYQQLKDFQTQFAKDQWKQTYEEEHIKVRYCRNQQECVVFTQTETDVGLELMAAVFGSLVRFSKFIKFSQTSKEIKRINTFNRLGEIVYDIPFCHQSKSYAQETVFDRIAHDGSVIIGYQSLFGNKQAQERLDYFPVFESECRLDYSKIICRLGRISNDKCRVEMLFRIRGKLQPIADWVRDKLFKNIGVASIKRMIEQCIRVGDETDTQILEGDNQLYNHFRKLSKRKSQ